MTHGLFNEEDQLDLIRHVLRGEPNKAILHRRDLNRGQQWTYNYRAQAKNVQWGVHCIEMENTTYYQKTPTYIIYFDSIENRIQTPPAWNLTIYMSRAVEPHLHASFETQAEMLHALFSLLLGWTNRLEAEAGDNGEPHIIHTNSPPLSYTAVAKHD